MTKSGSQRTETLKIHSVNYSGSANNKKIRLNFFIFKINKIDNGSVNKYKSRSVARIYSKNWV